jgi:DNA primase small subunit
MAVGWARYAFKFGEYYRTRHLADMWMPPRLRTREWMFDGFDDRPPERHRGFSRPADLLTHVTRKGPKSCFYSTAYYQDPNQRTMLEKGWRGADLIFDLDGDHLPGVTDGDFPAMLDVIQEQAWQLWNDFLEPEYGFDAQHLQVTFSGHRGFHLHYRAPDIWELDGNARREIVAHIKGEGVDVHTLLSGPDCAWRRRVLSGVDGVLSKLDVASRDDTEGRQMLRQLKEIIDMRRKSPNCEVKSCGVDTMRSIADKIQDPSRRKNLVDGIEQGSLKPVFGSRLDKVFRELVKGDGTVVLGNAGETDEVVTVDVKRVIRWPTSLHGKSGMKVVEFPIDRLDPDGHNPFDPLTEAVPWQMGTKDVKVQAIKQDAIYRIGESSGQLSEGEILEVDEATATFLVLKRWADPAE